MADDGLVAALARAQAKFGAIKKSHENPHFKSQYADIADVLEAVRPVLAAEGIAVAQPTRITDAGTVLVTKLMLGDEVLESEFLLPLHGLNAQAVLSWMTYMRRGCLCALVGVHPVGDDDDGNLAATAQTTAPKAEQMPTVMVPADWKTRPLAQMTFQELRAVAFELGHAFSGGSKSELIRQLEPLVRAASGEDAPFMAASLSAGLEAYAAQKAAKAEPEAIPFEPVVAGSTRKAVNSSMKAD